MSQQAYTISVIIPVFNGARYLGEAIQSVIEQTRPADEIIVVDDGSTDDSHRVAAQYPVTCIRQVNCGASAARNRGVSQSRGELLAFLDADDVWTTDKLALQAAQFEEHSDLDAVFGMVEQFCSPDVAEDAPQARFVGETLHGVHCGTMLIKRDSFLRVGWLNPVWKVAHFIEWYARAEDAGLNMITLPTMLMRRRVHTTNLTVRMRDTARLEYTKILKAALDRRRKH